MQVQSKGKRRIVLAVTAAIAALGLIGGVAIAMLGGAISGVNLATGLASGAPKPCQTDPVNFKFVTPAWNGSDKAFNIRQVSFTDVSSQCVSAGARLFIVVSEGNTTFLDTSIVPTGSSGTVDLTQPLNSNRAPSAEINYLVEG